MAWSSSDRRAQLPPDWSARRRRVLGRDGHRCRWPLTHGGECGAPAREVDHRDDPHDHHDSALWSLCGPHHQAKTQREAAAARAARPRPARRRPAEPHPGSTAEQLLAAHRTRPSRRHATRRTQPR